VVTLSAKTGSEYKVRNNAAIVAILAVLVVAVLIVCSLPVSSQNGSSTDADSGETHTVRYHLNYSGDLNESYNVTTIKAGDGSSSEPYVDVVYYGSLVSTEYNPQFWSKTIVNRSDVDWNWLEINDYVAGETVVFTGWSYHETSGTAHYPGEVLSQDDIENHLVNDVIHVYATWGTVDNAYLVSNGNRTLDGRTAYSLGNALNKIEGGSSYTNFLLIYGSTTDYGKVSFNSYTIGKPVTIRTDPVSEKLNKTMGRLNIGNQLYVDADLTIDDICLFGNSEGTTHGQGSRGIYARGHTLILGTGILSINTNSGDNAFKGYPQLFGGSNSASSTYSDHPDVNVYPARNDGEEIDTLMIVHSGTWYNVNGGSRYGTIPGSTCTVIKNAVILDTYNGAGLVGDSNSQFAGTVPTVKGVARSYFIDSRMPADTYGENILTDSVSDYDSPIPYYITETNFKNGSTLPEWPYRVDDADAPVRMAYRVDYAADCVGLPLHRVWPWLRDGTARSDGVAGKVRVLVRPCVGGLHHHNAFAVGSGDFSKHGGQILQTAVPVWVVAGCKHIIVQMIVIQPPCVIEIGALLFRICEVHGDQSLRADFPDRP